MPVELTAEVERLARGEHVSASQALVALVQRGLDAHKAERFRLETNYHRFMSESNPERKKTGR